MRIFGSSLLGKKKKLIHWSIFNTWRLLRWNSWVVLDFTKLSRHCKNNNSCVHSPLSSLTCQPQRLGGKGMVMSWVTWEALAEELGDYWWSCSWLYSEKGSLGWFKIHISQKSDWFASISIMVIQVGKGLQDYQAQPLSHSTMPTDPQYHIPTALEQLQWQWPHHLPQLWPFWGWSEAHLGSICFWN